MVINGERINCPDSWGILITRHYQKIIKDWDQDKDISERDYVKLFNIVNDTNFETPTDLEQLVKIESAVSWVVLENFRFSKEVPEVFYLNGRKANIEKNLKLLSIGANIKARQALDNGYVLIDDKGKFLNCDCFSTLVAIYLQPDLNPGEKGGFNWKKAQELEREIAEMPIAEIYPIGFFLLNRVYEYGQKREKGLKQILTNLGNKIRKTWLALLNSNGLYHLQTFLS